MTLAERYLMLAVMDHLLLNRGKLHYPPIVNGQIIRQQALHRITTMVELNALLQSNRGMIADCSQTSQVVIQIGIGRQIANYDVSTKWFLDNLPKYHEPEAAFIGGPCVWGENPGHHMALTHSREPMANPYMFSHGHDPAEIISFKNETIAQANRPWVFTSIAHLGR